MAETQLAFLPGTREHKAALISPCGKYRYSLMRCWDPAKKAMIIIGLNPSVADAEQDDPTIRICRNLAKRFGYGGIIMLNLFALRSTDPRAIHGSQDPVGPDNDNIISDILANSDGPAVVAWGNNAPCGRAHDVLDMLRRARRQPLCLAVTESGFPHHPLRLKIPNRLIPYSPSDERREHDSPNTSC